MYFCIREIAIFLKTALDQTSSCIASHRFAVLQSIEFDWVSLRVQVRNHVTVNSSYCVYKCCSLCWWQDASTMHAQGTYLHLDRME